MVVWRVVAPVLIVLVLTGGAMGYYFWRVTGSPFHIPYFVNVESYKPVPYFPWQAMRALPDYHHQVIEDHYLGWEFSQYQFAREHPGRLAGKKAWGIIRFFLGPLLIMPVVALLLAKRWRFFSSLTKPSKTRLLLFLSALSLVGVALPVVFFPHFVAPMAPALYALVMMAMRHLRLWQWHNRPVGRQMVRSVPVMAVAILVLHVSGLVLKLGPSVPSEDFGRSGILAQLQGCPGGQLVVVQYAPNHNADDEWVYNDADIDAAKVVWARDMGALANEELIRYFRDRRVWLLEADQSPPKLLPYMPMEENAGGSANLKPGDGAQGDRLQ